MSEAQIAGSIRQNHDLHPLLQQCTQAIVDHFHAAYPQICPLRSLKHIHGSKKVPVVVLSSSDDPHDITACHRDGANTYLVKRPILKDWSIPCEHFEFFGWKQSNIRSTEQGL